MDISIDIVNSGVGALVSSLPARVGRSDGATVGGRGTTGAADGSIVVGDIVSLNKGVGSSVPSTTGAAVGSTVSATTGAADGSIVVGAIVSLNDGVGSSVGSTGTAGAADGSIVVGAIVSLNEGVGASVTGVTGSTAVGASVAGVTGSTAIGAIVGSSPPAGVGALVFSSLAGHDPATGGSNCV